MKKTPKFAASSFSCAFCGAFAQMDWLKLEQPDDPFPMKGGPGVYESKCHACQKVAIWRATQIASPLGGPINLQGEMVFPQVAIVAHPHADMPQDCVQDFQEAAAIAVASPRAAAALLRLVVQKICIELGQPGKNINDDIAAMVRNGLPVQVKEALDVVRVTGNNAVHPGRMSAEDHAAIADQLFQVVNFIVEQQIAQPKKIASLFSGLPAGALSAIAKRDGAS